MVSFVTRILDLISPRSCVVCGRRLSPTERSLCSVCLFHLPRTTYQFSSDDNPVDQLFWGQLPVTRAAALMFYEPHSEMAQLIYQMKYNNRPDIGEDMGRLMAQEMKMGGFFESIDVLLPVPLSSKRQRQRGYNQSERLAQGISDVTGLPVCTRAVIRQEFQQSQTMLNRQERRKKNRPPPQHSATDGATRILPQRWQVLRRWRALCTCWPGTGQILCLQ